MSVEVSLKLINFGQYAIRTKDYNSITWFSCPVDLLVHPDMFGITGDEFKAFVWIVSVAAKCQSETIRLNISHASHLLSIEIDAVVSMLQKLESKRVLVESWPALGHELAAPRPESGQHLAAPRPGGVLYRTEQNRTEQHITSQGDQSAPMGKALDAPPPEPVVKKRSHHPKKYTPEQTAVHVAIWDAYKQAYLERHQQEPVYSRMAKGLCAQLRERLGEDAVQVVRFYVKHPKVFYQTQGHALRYCVSDCESLHLQWKKGKAITEADSKAAQRNQEHSAQWERMSNKDGGS